MPKTRYKLLHTSLAIVATAALGLSVPAFAQTPVVDDTPMVIESLSPGQLQDLVGPVALYPDDLLAVVLSASAYPLQIVQATRFLDELERDATLKPDQTWDESVVALINYPDVLRMMNDDLDWTYDLGAAVVDQQPDVIAAIETFRDRAYEAGNLKSDERQRVEREDDRIVITPVEREVIYVPYYEPERVVVVQSAPVYSYYPQPYPLYYYPFTARYNFHRPYFFGVSSVFQIGWPARHLNIHLWNYASHPFYGRRYGNQFYYHHRFQPARYRYRPLANSRGGYVNARNRNYRGDQWQPVARRNVRSLGHNRQRATRTNRSEYVSSFKPRDSRERRLDTATSRARTQSARSLAPKNGYRTNDTVAAGSSERIARANSTRSARSANRNNGERTTTTRRRSEAATSSRDMAGNSRAQTAQTREWRSTAPAVQQRARPTERTNASRAAATPQARPRQAPAAAARPAQRSSAPPAASARPAQRSSAPSAQRARSEPSSARRSEARTSRQSQSRSSRSDNVRRNRR